MRLKYGFVLILVLCLAGCVPPKTERVAKKNGYQNKTIRTSQFRLKSYQKISNNTSIINVYIEGDGRIKGMQNQLSNDPSPRAATVMQLAVLDPNPNVIYLARPCQFSPEDLPTVCERKYWTSGRYSNEVIDSMNQALDQIKQQSGTAKINLIGYSGGGAIAVLLAARRNDIASIRTIAGNLDLRAMEKHHDTEPLNNSLDPMDVAVQVQNIPQLHYVGDKDKIVPVIVIENFRAKANLKSSQVIVLKNVEHAKGWNKQWPTLLKNVP